MSEAFQLVATRLITPDLAKQSQPLGTTIKVLRITAVEAEFFQEHGGKKTACERHRT